MVKIDEYTSIGIVFSGGYSKIHSPIAKITYRLVPSVFFSANEKMRLFDNDDEDDDDNDDDDDEWKAWKK